MIATSCENNGYDNQCHCVDDNEFFTTTTTVTNSVSTDVFQSGLNRDSTVLNFEDFSLRGLLPAIYTQGSLVKPTSKVTTQYMDRGIVMENAALVECGLGHAASGKESLAGFKTIGAKAYIDYDIPLTFSFVAPVTTTTTNTVTTSVVTRNGEFVGNGNSIEHNNDHSDDHNNDHNGNGHNDDNDDHNGNGNGNDHNDDDRNGNDNDHINDHSVTESEVVTTTSAVTSSTKFVDGTIDYFAYSPDLRGCSGNIITLTAFDLLGRMVGQVEYVETNDFVNPLVLTGIGEFHSVTVDQTLYVKRYGGIALDDIAYGPIDAVGEDSHITIVGTPEVIVN